MPSALLMGGDTQNLWKAPPSFSSREASVRLPSVVLRFFSTFSSSNLRIAVCLLSDNPLPLILCHKLRGVNFRIPPPFPFLVCSIKPPTQHAHPLSSQSPPSQGYYGWLLIRTPLTPPRTVVSPKSCSHGDESFSILVVGMSFPI